MKWFLKNETKTKIMFLGNNLSGCADEVKKYFDTYAPEYGFEIIKSDSEICEKPDVVVFCQDISITEQLLATVCKTGINAVVLTPVSDEENAAKIMALKDDKRPACCVDVYTQYKNAGFKDFDSIAARAVIKALVNVTLTAPIGEFKDGEYHGFEKKNFYFKGREATFILPKEFAPGRPWCWRAEFLGAFDSADVSMLEHGWGLAYINLSDMYGCDEALCIMNEFHKELVKMFDLYEKTVLFGFSRGGLYSLNYGAKYHEFVSGLYLDAPVVDIYSWPGGFFTGCSSPETEVWKECKHLYNMCDEKTDSYIKLLPKKLDVLLENNIPIMYVAGGSDRVVPYLENGVFIVNEYLKRGGKIKIYIESWRDHHPHSLEEPMEIVRYIIDEMSPCC